MSNAHHRLRLTLSLASALIPQWAFSQPPEPISITVRVMEMTMVVDSRVKELVPLGDDGREILLPATKHDDIMALHSTFTMFPNMKHVLRTVTPDIDFNIEITLSTPEAETVVADVKLGYAELALNTGSATGVNLVLNTDMLSKTTSVALVIGDGPSAQLGQRTRQTSDGPVTTTATTVISLSARRAD